MIENVDEVIEKVMKRNKEIIVEIKGRERKGMSSMTWYDFEKLIENTRGVEDD